MKTLIFDGETALPISSEEIKSQLSLAKAVEYYQCGIIYRRTAKAFFAEQGYWHLNRQAELQEIEQGLELLFNRMRRELGEEMATLVLARTSADIILAEQ
jgi:hypothetical protein